MARPTSAPGPALTILALAVLAAPASRAAAPGEQLYADNCSACHQPAGQGVKGAFPPLAGNPLVLGEPKPLAGIVLTGRGGMPAFKDVLGDADLAAVLTYLRTAWSDKAGPVSDAQVAEARTAPPPPPPSQLQLH